MSFFGDRPHQAPSVVLPAKPVLLPEPQVNRPLGYQVPLHLGLDLIGNPNPSRQEGFALTWLSHELTLRHGARASTKEAPRAVVGVRQETGPVAEACRQAGLEIPDGEETYSIRFWRDGEVHQVLLAANTPIGLLRGVTTLAQLAAGNPAAPEMRAVEVDDYPSFPIRFLGGWALYRAHRLKDAIDLAFAFKMNRVLYNFWNMTAQERLFAEDAFLVEYARDRGIELVFETRRLAFGKEFRLDDERYTGPVLALFDQAVQTGFRVFGIMFDDQEMETAEAECDMFLKPRERLTDQIGATPEMYFCPQYYWFPGEQFYRKPADKTEREAQTAHQRTYLETLGRLLPSDVHVHLANWWNDVADDFETETQTQFIDLVGRKPIFFDNQAINDYRVGLVLPFPLHRRPADLPQVIEGYYVNSGWPLSAYAANVATSAAYAWNTRSYNPASHGGSALLHIFGDRAGSVSHYQNCLNDLFNELSVGHPHPVNHYDAIWARITEGELGAKTLDQWIARCTELKEIAAGALSAAGDGMYGNYGGAFGPAGTLAFEAAAIYLREAERLLLELRMFRKFVSLKQTLPTLQENQQSARIALFQSLRSAALQSVAAILAERLVPAHNTVNLLFTLTGDFPFERAHPADNPGYWWVTHTYASAIRKLRKIASEQDRMLMERSGKGSTRE